MQKFWHIPVYPRPRRVTATSLPIWDENDPTHNIPIHEDTFFDTIPAWAFTVLTMGAFFLCVIIFGYILTG